MQATKVRTEQQGARVSSAGGAAKAPDFVYQRTIRIQAGAPSAAEPWNGEAAVDAANADVPAAESTLSEGMRLGAYEVIDVIGRGGFGIVYLAFDKTLEQHVAVKEYMPASLASRVPLSPHVVPKVALPECLWRGAAQLHQRGPPARAFQPSGADQGASLLGSQRHGLHGHALLPGADARARTGRSRPFAR